MLHQFLNTNRAELIDQCRIMVQERRASSVDDPAFEFGIPQFLNQVIKTLEAEQTSEPIRSLEISGTADGKPGPSEISSTAVRHGRELHQQGFTVEQVVHDYGDLCQAITSMAFDQNAPIQADEFKTLNRCLDNGIADAVKEYARQRDTSRNDKSVNAVNERLGSLAHELRNHTNTATLAVTVLKSGNVGLHGATAAVLDRSLIALRNLIDCLLADVRVTAGMPARHQLVSVADFVAEVKTTASLEAEQHKCRLTVGTVDPTLTVNVDRDLLSSAVGNLLQNAFKFSVDRLEISLKAYEVGSRVFIDIEDSCGGLPSGAAENMFKPFSQSGPDKSGVGLGLSICRRSVEANNGSVRVRDIPGAGCVFTIDLPRHSPIP